MEVFGLMQPVATRPAVRIACGDGCTFWFWLIMKI
jgi:hypothetical protein